MTAGVTTPNLTSTALADSLVVNRGGSTYLQTLAALGAQLASTGPLAVALLAQAARIDQIEIDGDVYATTGAGLADTVVGAQFRVRSSDPDVAYRVYRHDAGPVATLILEAPSVAVLAAKADQADLDDEVAARKAVTTALTDRLDAVPAVTDPAIPDAEVLVDEVGAILRRTRADGEMFVPDLAGRSVQASINETARRMQAGAGARRRAMLQVEDDAGNITMMQDERGGLYLPGYPGSVQAALGMPLAHSPRFPTQRDRLHDSILPLTAALRAEGLPFIEPPPLLVPNRFDVPDSIISAFACEAGTGQWLETPYADGGLVHPYLLEMRQPLLGYRYLMAESPHLAAVAWEENPILYGSNDLKTFDLIMDVAQPLGHAPGNNSGYNSDPAFTYDPRNGEFVCFWRGYTGGLATLHYRSTWNGVDWTPKRSVATGQAGWISPAILFDPLNDIWHLWKIHSEGTVQHFTGATPYGPWTLIGSDNLLARFGILVWHLEVKWLGSRFALLANQRGELPGANLFLGLSADGTTWDMGPGLIQPAIPHVYKGTFIPEFDGDNMRLHLAWNIYFYPLPPGLAPVFHCRPTNWVDLTSL